MARLHDDKVAIAIAIAVTPRKNSCGRKNPDDSLKISNTSNGEKLNTTNVDLLIAVTQGEQSLASWSPIENIGVKADSGSGKS